ncbi:MAG: hypothetical protein CMJ52_02750 [Planctomycetaceae bacterium]|nr:hypothetical protein [Planctomycetaceae bacterium]
MRSSRPGDVHVLPGGGWSSFSGTPGRRRRGMIPFEDERPVMTYRGRRGGPGASGPVRSGPVRSVAEGGGLR